MAENFTSPVTVKCLMATAVDTVEVRDRKLEQLATGQVRLKTEYSMVSTGTELHRIQDTHTKRQPFPCMTGYIALGHVVGLGQGVSQLKLGDRVLFRYAHFSMIDAPAEQCRLLPPELAGTDAICTPLISISIRAVRAARTQLGDSVAIFGQGVVGLFATHLAKLAGACPVIAVDPVAARRQIARKMGADATIDPLEEDVAKRVMEITGGRGVNAAIDASATTKVIATLPAITAAEGRVIVLGGVHGKVELDLYSHFQKSNLTMIGCGSAYHRDYPYDSDEANFAAILRLMQAGMIRPAPAVTHCVNWTEGPRMYRMLIQEKDKAVGVQFDWRNA
jgi:2-desacetyl-2-hydroxyethyl bacteriochlorophyllide A dehydrogenase